MYGAKGLFVAPAKTVPRRSMQNEDSKNRLMILKTQLKDSKKRELMGRSSGSHSGGMTKNSSNFERRESIAE